MVGDEGSLGQVGDHSAGASKLPAAGMPDKKIDNVPGEFVAQLRKIIAGRGRVESPVEWSSYSQPVVVQILYKELFALGRGRPDMVGSTIAALLEDFAPPKSANQDPHLSGTRSPEEQEVCRYLQRLVTSTTDKLFGGERILRDSYDTRGSDKS